MFPKSVDIYDNHLNWIYDRTDDWFLIEQCLPELADELRSEKNHMSILKTSWNWETYPKLIGQTFTHMLIEYVTNTLITETLNFSKLLKNIVNNCLVQDMTLFKR